MSPKAASVAQIANESIFGTSTTLTPTAADRKAPLRQSHPNLPTPSDSLLPRGSRHSLSSAELSSRSKVPSTTVDHSGDSKDKPIPKRATETSLSTCSRPESVDDHVKNKITPSSKGIFEPDSSPRNQSTWPNWFAKSQRQPMNNDHANGSKSPGRRETEVEDSLPTFSHAKTTQPEAASSELRDSDHRPMKEERETAKIDMQSMSWLGMMRASRDDTPKHKEQPPQDVDHARTQGKALSRIASPSESTNSANPSKSESNNHDAVDRGSGWAFWSKAPTTNGSSYAGQLAVTGTALQSQPQDAIVGPMGIPKLPSTLLGKRMRPLSLQERDEATRTKHSNSEVAENERNESSSMPGSTNLSLPNKENQKQTTQNLLLPLFENTYAITPDVPSFLQQIGQFFYGKAPQMKHPTLLKGPPRIRKALAIGIHGYFPTPIIQSVLGRPTGTSMKFADSAAMAIQRFCESQECAEVAIEKIALEGEGKIEERLDILCEYMPPWTQISISCNY